MHGMVKTVVKYCYWLNVVESIGYFGKLWSHFEDVPEGQLRDKLPTHYVRRYVTDFKCLQCFCLDK